MKKSLVKLAALSSAAFVLAGPVASVAVAEDATAVITELTKQEFDTEDAANTAKQNALLIQGIKEAEKLEVVSVGGKWKLQVKAAESAPELEGYGTEAEAIAAAKEALKIDTLNNSYKITQGANGRYFYQLFLEETEAPEETTKPEERHITNIPFDTEEDARKAAEKHLKEDKVNKSYKIVKGADNKFYVELSTEEAEAPEAPEAEVDGYATKEEAEAAAKKALEKDPINKSFDVRQGANGRWYYVLSPVEVEKPAEPKPEEPKPETPEKDLDTVKKEALARLDLLKALTKAEVEHFTKAILNAESANEVAAIIKEAEDVNFSVNLEAETPAKEVKPEESKEGSKKEEKKEDKKEKLPETGEVSSFAIFGGAALSVLAGLGLVASKKEEK